MTKTNLTSAVEKAIEDSGLNRSEWAAKHGISNATLHDLIRKGTAAGKTLAKLQKAGVRIADKKLIASLDAA